jgi:uncharacterized protein (TIGR00369 family)
MSEESRLLSMSIAPGDLVGTVNPRLNYTITACADGFLRAAWSPTRDHSNPAGMVHGGYVSMVVDDCCGMAINSLLPSMVALPTVTLKVDFLRGIRVGGSYEAVGSVTRIGRQVSFSDCEIRDDAGRLLARGEGVFTADLSDSGLVGFTTR